MAPIHVVKLGGSLLDMVELKRRFTAWQSQLPPCRVLLVVGGGAAADVVRDMDKTHGLGESVSHWLAIRAMGFNAHVVAAVLGEGFAMAESLEAAEGVWAAGKSAVVAPYAWLMEEEKSGHGIAHRWTFTSDSVAGHIAARVGAGRLTMLKSVSPKKDELGRVTAQGLADQGMVDTEFPGVVAGLAEVWVCNLRRDGTGHESAVRLG